MSKTIKKTFLLNPNKCYEKNGIIMFITKKSKKRLSTTMSKDTFLAGISLVTRKERYLHAKISLNVFFFVCIHFLLLDLRARVVIDYFLCKDVFIEFLCIDEIYQPKIKLIIYSYGSLGNVFGSHYLFFSDGSEY